MFKEELEALQKARRAAHQKAYRERNKAKLALIEKTYREANKEKIKEQKKDWYERNKDKVLDYRSKYYQANKEKQDAYRRSYEQNNKDKIAEMRRAYREKNKDKIAANNKARRFRKTTIINHLLVNQRGRCAACKCNVIEKHHLDHIVPLANGGTNNRSNFQLLCVACNRSKSAKDPLAFMQERGKLL